LNEKSFLRGPSLSPILTDPSASPNRAGVSGRRESSTIRELGYRSGTLRPLPLTSRTRFDRMAPWLVCIRLTVSLQRYSRVARAALLSAMTLEGSGM
jgi:hypothetical protein